MKKKYLVIVAVIVLLAVSVFVSIKLFSNNDISNGDNKGNKTEVKEPASNTEELLTSSKELANTNVTKDKIEFDNSINLASGDKIAIWLYSTPKFLGWFEVKEENGTKYINGLEQALEKENIDSGSHHLAIANKDNETLGYVNVDINEDNNIEEVDAIKELGIPQDFYSFTSFYLVFHIHFNKDYTFNIDNDGVVLEKNGYYLTDKIKFTHGKYKLVEKDSEHIMLKLTFYNNEEVTLEEEVAIHSIYNGNEYLFEVMEFRTTSGEIITSLLASKKTNDTVYFPTLFNDWWKYLE